MKKYFVFIFCFLLMGAFWIGSCGESKPDPCETDPGPECPNYVDPCEIDPQPGCPNYVDPEMPVLASSITIGTVEYVVDDKKIEKLDDDLWYMYAQTKNAAKPLIIHSVRYTTTSTGYGIETWVGNDSITGKERPQAMVNRYEQAGREVKMVINGGFFGMSEGGTPIGWQASKGLLTFLPSEGEELNFPIIGFDNQNLPYMDFMNFTGKVKKESDNSEWDITHINGGRWTDFLVLYNSYRGKRTGTNQYGIEALCNPLERDWEIYDSYTNVRCKVEQISTQGNMIIPKGKIVLSGHGTADNQFLNTLKVGDYVYVTVDYALKDNPKITSTTIRNTISGYPYIILKDNNVIHSPGLEPALENQDNPRTSVGYSADKKYVYFTVVEGRNPTQAAPTISAGVSTGELAQVMQYFGAAHAINLDGGGSTCMMIGKDTKNFVSDGSQRAVADGLAIIKK